MRFLPTTLKTTAALAVAALGLTAAAGCDANSEYETVDPTVTPTDTVPDTTVPNTTLGDDLNTGADRTGAAMNNAADTTGNAMESAADNTAAGMNRAADGTQNTIEDIQAGAGATTKPAMK